MDPLTTAAASGLRARMEALDMLANNIANASTPGFKRDGEFYGTYQEAEAQAVNTDISLLPVVEKPWTDMSQGTLQNTGNHLDLALDGPGFFAVNGPSGTLYTRNGGMHVDASGAVTTQEGYPVRLAGGTTLKIRPGIPLVAASDGTLTQNRVPLGRLEIVNFPEGALVKNGSTLFRAADPAQTGKPVGDGTAVHQGKLESANVSSPEAAARLITLTRQFEALQRAISIGADMNRRSVEELARL